MTIHREWSSCAKYLGGGRLVKFMQLTPISSSQFHCIEQGSHAFCSTVCMHTYGYMLTTWQFFLSRKHPITLFIQDCGASILPGRPTEWTSRSANGNYWFFSDSDANPLLASLWWLYTDDCKRRGVDIITTLLFRYDILLVIFRVWELVGNR